MYIVECLFSRIMTVVKKNVNLFNPHFDVNRTEAFASSHLNYLLINVNCGVFLLSSSTSLSHRAGHHVVHQRSEAPPVHGFVVS